MAPTDIPPLLVGALLAMVVLLLPAAGLFYNHWANRRAERQFAHRCAVMEYDLLHGDDDSPSA